MEKNNFLSVILVSIIGSLLLFSCAPSRFVKPLNKGEKNIGATFGGEMIEFGNAVIPVPLTSIAGGYGIDSSLTIFGGLHTTALYFGNLQLDAGCTKRLYQSANQNINISASPVLNFIADLNDPVIRLWPQLDVNVYGFFNDEKKHYAYLGVSNWFEPASKRANDQPVIQHWIVNPQMGAVFALKKHWQLTTEIKLLAPNQPNTYSFVPWKSLLGSYGATAVFFGISKTF